MHISNKSLLIASVPLALLLACPAAKSAGDPGSPAKKQAAQEDPNAFAPLPDIPAGHDAAIFAGGCFWCMETAFEGQPGVRSVTSGYSGGELKDPTYKQVSSRRTKHAEVVQVVFDTKATSYEKLLEIFWHNVDPTTPGRQFCDVGPEYRSEVFVKNAAQRAAAEKSKAAIQKTKTFKGDLVTPITDARPFYAAER